MGVELWATDKYVRDWGDMESSQVCPGKDFNSLFICLIWDGGLVSLECDVLDGLQFIYSGFALRIKSHFYYFVPVLLCIKYALFPSQLNTAFVRS